MRAMAEPHADPHGSDAMAGPHGSMADPGETHGHDDHAHAVDAMALGAVDVYTWGAALIGIVAGLAVAVVLALSAALGSNGRLRTLEQADDVPVGVDVDVLA